MAKFLINGRRKLNGKVSMYGAKNSALPILAATILCEGECIIHNCPRLTDVTASIDILRHLGCTVCWDKDSLIINTRDICRYEIPDALMREMRSSIVFLGAIIARLKKAKLSLPGGCELGPRPIDLHLKALSQLGVCINEKHGCIDCNVKGDIKGCGISLSFPSVGATENIILASVLAKGRTIITNVAREPEILDLVDYLNKSGAQIYGAGEGTIIIEGVEKLHGCEHSVIPDRIAAITFMSAAAVTGGDITIEKVTPAHLISVIPIFEESGCNVKVSHTEQSIKIKAPAKLKPNKIVRTMPYPGFPTDAQAPVMVMSTLAGGMSVFVENIFESRYKHVGELTRLGANIKVEGRVAIVEGVENLYGASVQAMDLRGSAALTVAGLAAEGMTEVSGLNHIDRGYESIEVQLASLGADIKRI